MKNAPSFSHKQSLQKFCHFNTIPDQILNEWDQDRLDNWFGKKACKSWWNKALFRNCAHILWLEFKICKERSPFREGNFALYGQLAQLSLGSFYRVLNLFITLLFLIAKKTIIPHTLFFGNYYLNLYLQSPCDLPFLYSEGISISSEKQLLLFSGQWKVDGMPRDLVMDP